VLTAVKKTVFFVSQRDDFIKIAEEGVLYKNIDVKKLISIQSELIELNGMIGLQHIKQSIFEQLLFYLQELHKGSEMYFHTVIYGPPGTGKTSVAKLLGRIFSKLQILVSEDDEEIFECAKRDDLIGEYLGHTSAKTREFLEMCLGGVVFIDEVYSLGNKEGGDSFAKESIDTINLFLSEYRNEFMMIVAGYKDEIDQCFFKYNEGLKRRFMWYHTIEPYTKEELKEIFLLKIKQSEWTYADEVPICILEMIHRHPQLFVSNAGSIENILTLIKIKHSKRVFLLPAKEKKCINHQDIEVAINELTKSQKSPEYLNFYM
jgi:stage V sporulation protein K